MPILQYMSYITRRYRCVVSYINEMDGLLVVTCAREIARTVFLLVSLNEESKRGNACLMGYDSFV